MFCQYFDTITVSQIKRDVEELHDEMKKLTKMVEEMNKIIQASATIKISGVPKKGG